MTNVETGVQMPLVGWRLGYDRAAVAGVLAVAEMDVADGIACAVSGEGDGLDLVRDIVQAMGCSSLWTCGTGDRDRVDVLADFTCDGEGFMVNDHHLTLSVYLHTGAVIADCGLRRLTDLPRAKFETVYDVLDGVTALLNEVVERAARALVGQEPPAALPLQVVPLSDLRTAVAEDLSIPAAEALAVSAASDDVLAQALRDSWGLVEERFFDLRAELIGAARQKLTVVNGASADNSAATRDDAGAFFHALGIGVFGNRFAVTWPGGASSWVEKDHPDTGGFYEALADALDAIEEATSCSFHDGDQRDATGCTCDEPTIAAGA